MEVLFAILPWALGIAAICGLLYLGYVKAPPDTAYIISGFRKPRILIGKAGIRIPFFCSVSCTPVARSSLQQKMTSGRYSRPLRSFCAALIPVSISQLA